MASTAVETPAPEVAWKATETSSDAQAEEAPGLPRKVFRFFGNVGHRIVDNMSFVGEVLVEFLELDKHPYHREMEDLRKAQRKKQKTLQQQEEQKQAREAAEIASLEEAQSVDAAETDIR
ncbi:unnamed protein product [Cladocopium goreaui]|uniref:Protein kinase domain-containing protein n=1 Tax=Cladocopium goreaui TaxID=2562237 RepID=A0A9P1G949_9DINO|nr:unnamed protein product [Cladocopium goreaui]|mmetsp:Transcript_55976/g.122419  ORF Transcript_55976/g.122419 Transcript_55976/m.122419 type:complete len:120 (+) Transcript_55976:52-411(+)